MSGLVYLRLSDSGKIIEVTEKAAREFVADGKAEIVSVHKALAEGFSTIDGKRVPGGQLDGSVETPAAIPGFGFVKITEDSAMSVPLEEGKIYHVGKPAIKESIEAGIGEEVTRDEAIASGYRRYEERSIPGKKKARGGLSTLGGSAEYGLRRAGD